MDLGELERRGLYDPDAPDADERRELLAYLVSLGIDHDHLVYADRMMMLTYAPVVHAFAGRGWTTSQLIDRVGISEDQFVAFWRTAGLRPPGADQPLLGEADERMLRLFTEVDAGLEREIGEEVLRSIGAACAQIAETAVAAFVQSIDRDDIDTGSTDLDRAKFNQWAITAIRRASEEISTLVEHHTRAAIMRWMGADEGASEGHVRFAVGFVDLVGYTTLSERLSVAELGALLRRLEATAVAAATEHDGRVVKLIGDEVMFVAVDAAGACDIALTLVETFEEHATGTTPRGGLAVGDVIGREGDYYGATVNLASRLATGAIPGEVLVSDALEADVKDARYAFEPAGKRLLKGFSEPQRLYSVARA